MARRIVVTVSALGALSCGSAAHDIAPIRRNPPAPNSLNATNPDHGMVYRGNDDTCYVHVPDGRPLAPGQMPPTKTIECPESMKVPGWEACIGGQALQYPDDGHCECFWTGNPPPPSATIECPLPKKTKRKQ